MSSRYLLDLHRLVTPHARSARIVARARRHAQPARSGVRWRDIRALSRGRAGMLSRHARVLASSVRYLEISPISLRLVATIDNARVGRHNGVRSCDTILFARDTILFAR